VNAKAINVPKRFCYVQVPEAFFIGGEISWIQTGEGSRNEQLTMDSY